MLIISQGIAGADNISQVSLAGLISRGISGADGGLEGWRDRREVPAGQALQEQHKPVGRYPVPLR